MDDQAISRRLFMIKSCAGLGSAWIVSHLPEIAAAQEHVHIAAQSSVPPKFEFFTPEQAIEVERIPMVSEQAHINRYNDWLRQKAARDEARGGKLRLAGEAGAESSQRRFGQI